MKIHKISPAFLVLLAALVGPASAQAQVSHLDRVTAAKKVRVCIWPDYFGISLRSPKTQQLSGIDSDLAMELGKDLGVGVEFVDTNFAKLVADLTGDRCDVAMFGVGVTPSRAEKLRFTQPTMASDIYAITTRSNRRMKNWDDIDKTGAVVAVMKGTLHEPVMRERLKAAALVVVDTPMAREQEVEAGRADVFMTDFPYSRRMLDTTDWARLISPPSAYHMTQYAYALAPGDDKWFNRLEQFVRDIKRDGRLLSAATRYRLDPIIVKD
jgi:cyclohexadienyl dehydratase